MGNPFAGLKTGKVSGAGQYLSPGFDGVLEVKKVEWLEELQTDGGGSALVVEFTIVESNNETDEKGKIKDPVNATRSWFQKKNKSFDGAVLEFLYGMMKVDWKNDEDMAAKIREKSPDLMAKALDNAAFNGKRVRCRTIQKTTKENKKPFTKHIWSPDTPAVAA
jgi:hypothetical protein